MRKGTKGHIFESTGREFYANGYIGAYEADNGVIEIAQGYDGGIDIEGDFGSELTNQERIELADYMIGLWAKFKEQSV